MRKKEVKDIFIGVSIIVLMILEFIAIGLYISNVFGG